MEVSPTSLTVRSFSALGHHGLVLWSVSKIPPILSYVNIVIHNQLVNMYTEETDVKVFEVFAGK